MFSFTTQTTADRRQLYRVTNRILNDNSLHFILISLLFLPLTFSASAAVKFYLSASRGTDVTTMFDPFNLFLIKTIIASSVKTLITVLAFTCFVILPTVAGVALITYSTHQAIHRKPLTFSSTLKSLSHSYIPLLHTIIAGSITLIILFLVFTISPIAVTEAFKALGLGLGFHSGGFVFSVFINTIVSYALAFAIIFFIVIWGSAAAITVLESKSGFETLRQSANQSTEFRRHSFSIVYITGFGVGSALGAMARPILPQNSGPAAKWMLILQAGTFYLVSLLMILLYVVANTVLYVQCKVASGEEIAKTAVESGEDVTLVVNDDGDSEVFHELGKEKANGGFNYLLYLLAMFSFILLCVQFYYLSMIL